MVYRSATSPGAVLHIHDAEVGLVEPAEVDGSEEDGPDLIGDLLEADGVLFEQAADEDFPISPSHRAVARDPPNLEVIRIFDGFGVVAEGPIRGSVDGGRGLHLEGFVGSLSVIEFTEFIEAPLLRRKVRAGWKGGAFLEGAVHAFMSPVLLWLAGLDQLGLDAERDPPDGELGEAGNGRRGEGMSVVGADPPRQAKSLKEAPKAPDRCLQIETQHGAAFEKEAGVAVLDREREAELAVQGPELALEVSGPGGVGLRLDGKRRTGMHPSTPRLPGIDAAVSPQDSGDGIRAGDLADVRVILELPTNLSSAPVSRLPDGEDALDDGLGCRVGATLGAVGSILQPPKALRLVPLEPLVAGRSADPVSTTELRMR